jgi:hypothetical protein
VRAFRIVDGSRPLGEEVVRDPLNVAMLDVTEACSTEARHDVVAQRGLVASDRARLVDVA